MVYMRGSPVDYDEWQQRGCTGWGWENVRRSRSAVVVEPRQHLAGEVLRIAGAAPVAGEEELLAALKRLGRNLGDIADRTAEGQVVYRHLQDLA
jgi:choline dehydrogenase-like flavoprotein